MNRDGPIRALSLSRAGESRGPWRRITHAPIVPWSDGFSATALSFYVQGLGVHTGGPAGDPAAYLPDQSCTVFRVIAVDEDGLESPPTPVRDPAAPPSGTCPTTPPAPTNLVASTLETVPPCTTSLDWDPVPGATEYHVFRMKLDESDGGKFFYRTAITSDPWWDETGTGMADGVTNDGPCPYGALSSTPNCTTGKLDAFYVQAKGVGGGLSPRSNVAFWNCSTATGGYARLEPGRSGAWLARARECRPADAAPAEPGQCPVAEEWTSAAGYAASPATDGVRYAVLGQAADPDYDIIDLYADHLGSTRVTATDGGVILTRTTYLPFGEPVFAGATDWNTHRFTGHERDDGTGLDYMLARYYGGGLPRFLSPDPFGGTRLDPQSWNRYSYVGNNPLIFLDPFGLTKILGIHSNVGPSAGFTDGHAWITVHDTDTGTTDTYGLWPDQHPRTVDNGDGSDVRHNLEQGAGADSSRYYELSDEQAEKLDQKLGESDAWSYTNTCASWASCVVREVTGEDVDADDWLGLETPREVSRSIKKLEKNDPTAPDDPKEPKDDDGSSSSKNKYGIDPDGPFGPAPNPCQGMGPLCR